MQAPVGTTVDSADGATAESTVVPTTPTFDCTAFVLNLKRAEEVHAHVLERPRRWRHLFLQQWRHLLSRRSSPQTLAADALFQLPLDSSAPRCDPVLLPKYCKHMVNTRVLTALMRMPDQQCRHVMTVGQNHWML